MTDVGSTPQLVAPTLADLSARIDGRPSWAVKEPLAIDRDTFERAETEMFDVQKRRGFPVPRSEMDQPNFLLRGVPVVMNDR